jgi:multiple sugar transport system ATP-binding protein
MAAVTLESVSKRYGGGADVVHDVSFEARDGELVTLVGPSGCGKSTLLNLIAGLETPSSGRIRIGDRAVNDVSPGERDIAMVFQSYALYPHLTVRANIGFPLDVAGVARAEIARRVGETAERLGLVALLDRKPAQLSGGQRQRVALGRALVRRPKAFLLDEPLSNLDAALRTQMRGELKKLHESLRATFLYVTHDQAEAMTLSDRVVVLSRGTVQQIAPPRELYARPKNVFVAGFFGSPPINLVPPDALGLAPREGVVAGVRPEDVRLGAGPAPEGAVTGRVYLVEPMGAECWITVERGDARIVARAPASFAGHTGETVWIAVERERALLFDARGGERIEA